MRRLIALSVYSSWMCAYQASMGALDLRAFTASILTSGEGLAAASRTLESCLAGPDIPLDLIVQDLCSVPNLFEFIISGEFLILVVPTLLVSDPDQPRQSVKNWRTKSWMPSQRIRHLSRHRVQVSFFESFHLLSLLYLPTFSLLKLFVKLGGIRFM